MCEPRGEPGLVCWECNYLCLEEQEPQWSWKGETARDPACTSPPPTCFEKPEDFHPSLIPFLRLASNLQPACPSPLRARTANMCQHAQPNWSLSH